MATRGRIRADLALHDLAEIYWPSIEDEYYDVVGEYSYNTARDKVDEVIDLIGLGSSDTKTRRIDKILEFIEKYIAYEYDVNDIFSAPVETLGPQICWKGGQFNEQRQKNIQMLYYS